LGYNGAMSAHSQRSSRAGSDGDLAALEQAPYAEPAIASPSLEERSTVQAPQGTFASLHLPEYRLFFFAALISNSGMWMQSVAQGWLVVTLSRSEFYVGLVGFCATVPNLFLSLLGGVLADRVDKRWLLIVSQVLLGVIAGALGLLIFVGRIQLWHLMLLSFLSGVVGALTNPAFQAIVPEIVGKRYLMNAIALNSAQFNLTRILGPTIGGALLNLLGTAAMYFANALSYFVFALAMYVIRPKYPPQHRAAYSEGIVNSLLAAWRYVWSHGLMRVVVLLAVVQTIFLFPYTTLLPVFAKEVLHAGAMGYSMFLTAMGVGAFIAALMLASIGDTPHKGRLMITAQLVFAAAVMVFAVSRWLPLSMLALPFAGWGMVTYMATGNTLLQAIVTDDMRGRVMSIWVLAGLGMMPVGNLLAGALAAWLTPTIALVLGAIVTVILTLLAVRWEPAMMRPQVFTPES